MKRFAATGFAVLLLAAGGAFAAGAPSRASTPPLASVRALARAMATRPCATAELRSRLVDPLGGAPRELRGRVRVEAPDRVAIDFAGGERIALRADGGEWLQPATHQLLRIPADRARTALQWWRVLLPNSGVTFREDSLAPRRFTLVPRDAESGGAPVGVTLGADGYPASLTIEGLGDEPMVYRLSKWTFGPARGERAYRLTAPAGFETVELP